MPLSSMRHRLNLENGAVQYAVVHKTIKTRLQFPTIAFFVLSLLTFSCNLEPCSAFQPLIAHRTTSRFHADYTYLPPSSSSSSSSSSSIIESSTQLNERVESLPSWGELSQQKSDALRSLSSYHDGGWSCDDGALSFSITSDVTGGMTRKKRSVPYCTSVSTRLGVSGRGADAGLKIAETLSWETTTTTTTPDDTTDTTDTTNTNLPGNIVFVRACALGSTIDIDSVDASYSLDGFCTTTSSSSENTQEGVQTFEASASCGLPSALSGVDPRDVSFVVEHVLVIDETQRARCFLLYKDEDSDTHDESQQQPPAGGVKEAALLRVVIAYETKNTGSSSRSNQEAMSSQSTTDEYSRLDQLTDAIGKSGGMEENNILDQRILCPMSLMTLSSGPWLGDIIVRDRSFNHDLPKSPSDTKKQKSVVSKGFGKKTTTPPPPSSSPVTTDPNEGFAEWILGVQKAAITYKWDIGQNIRQVISLGKSLGCGTSNDWPLSSRGMIYNDDGMSRRFKPQDRAVYIDYEMGIYGGFLFGSAYVKAPRFFKFNNSQRTSNGLGFPMLTEFAVFQKTRDDDVGIIDDESSIEQEVCTSRITRLYGQDCKFIQGCTSFFTLKPAVDDDGL